MLTLKRNNRINRSINRFLLKEQRLQFQLSEMIQLLKYDAHFTELQLLLYKQQTVPHIFKFLILINRLILLKQSNSDRLLNLISKLKWFSCGDMQKMISQKLIKPYQLFLQKRILYESSTKEKNIEKDEIGMYRLINLLHAGTSFVNMIYILGRYYKRGWIVEFNIGICMDLKIIYNKLVESMLRPTPKEFLEHIEALHQKLYLAFYNCYFHKHVKPYVPTWIKTDFGLITPQKKDAKRPISLTKTFDSSSSKGKSKGHPTAESEKNLLVNSVHLNLESSSCFLFNEAPKENIEIDDNFFEDVDERIDTNEKRFQLIKDMEKIVSMICQ